MMIGTLCCLCCWFSVTLGVYFSHPDQHLLVPVFVIPGSRLTRPYSLPSDIGNSRDSVTCSVGKVWVEESRLQRDVSGLFGLSEGWVVTAQWFNSAQLYLEGTNIALTIQCSCPTCQYSDPANSTILRVSVLNASLFEEEVQKGGCPQGPISLEITENTAEGVVIGRLGAIGHEWVRDMNVKVLEEEEGSKHLSIDPSTSEISVNVPYDREKQEEHTVSYICTSHSSTSSGSGSSALERRGEIRLKVRDVNDNGPYITNNGVTVKTEHVRIKMDKSQKEKSVWLHSTSYHVVDADSLGVNNIEAQIDGPDGDYFMLADPMNYTHGKRKSGHMYSYMLHIRHDFDFTSLGVCQLNFRVLFTDNSLRLAGDDEKENAEQGKQAVYNVTIVPKTPSMTSCDGPVSMAVNSNPGAERSAMLPSIGSRDMVDTPIVAALSDEAMAANEEENRPLRAHPLTMNAYLTTSAAKFSRLTQLAPTFGTWTYTYNRSLPAARVLAVTEYEGIVYVRGDPDTVILRQLGHSDLSLGLDILATEVNKHHQEDVHIDVKVSIFNTGKACTSFHDSCSLHRVRDQCEMSCGIGVKEGSCTWRENNASMALQSRWYSTCSPSLATCPDTRCDALERLQPKLCPQDCAETVRGSYLRNHDSNRGIERAQGTCWCDKHMECTCLTDHHDHVDVETLSKLPTRNNYDKERHGGEDEELLPHQVLTAGSGLVCSTWCRIMLISALCALVIIPLTVLLCWWWRRQRHSHMKQSSSMISMSALPSDYMDDRDRQVSGLYTPHSYSIDYSSASIDRGWSPRIANQYTTIRVDRKWEFSRKNLTLGKEIGEGEFGRVVMAKALNINGHKGSVDVAVKMLKDGASSAEFQDLMSEYNLLKDVNHPNVIRLLGASTQGGPLYVIVEYCDYGCLRSYLRSRRHKGRAALSANPKKRKVQYTVLDHHTEDDEVEESRNQEHDGTQQQQQNGTSPQLHTSKTKQCGNDDHDDGDGANAVHHDIHDDEVLTSKDLVSFAWQITKGMQYLSEMKIVHRDLAARNVLLSAGLQAKVSDFGLSRDVYERDSYTKESKGRIPVKWMAPESLYDQVYTSKSDVWSFGVVLWEIVTLGANPYPGVPAERLYNMLRSGYRMDKPQGCSDKLFSMMNSCWSTEPVQRQSFKSLAHDLEHALQEDVEYLDVQCSDTVVESDEETPGNSAETAIVQDDDEDSKSVENPIYGSVLAPPRPLTHFPLTRAVTLTDPLTASRSSSTAHIRSAIAPHTAPLPCIVTTPPSDHETEESRLLGGQAGENYQQPVCHNHHSPCHHHSHRQSNPTPPRIMHHPHRSPSRSPTFHHLHHHQNGSPHHHTTVPDPQGFSADNASQNQHTMPHTMV